MLEAELEAKVLTPVLREWGVGFSQWYCLEGGAWLAETAYPPFHSKYTRS